MMRSFLSVEVSEEFLHTLSFMGPAAPFASTSRASEMGATPARGTHTSTKLRSSGV